MAILAPSQFSACNAEHGTTTTLTVFGATSFVGQILTRYLYGRFGTDGDLRWAIAGRSEKKLRELHGSLYPKAAKLPQIVANAGDEKALREMPRRSPGSRTDCRPLRALRRATVKICANTGTVTAISPARCSGSAA